MMKRQTGALLGAAMALAAVPTPPRRESAPSGDPFERVPPMARRPYGYNLKESKPQRNPGQGSTSGGRGRRLNVSHKSHHNHAAYLKRAAKRKRRAARKGA